MEPDAEGQGQTQRAREEGKRERERESVASFVVPEGWVAWVSPSPWHLLSYRPGCEAPRARRSKGGQDWEAEGRRRQLLG